MRQKISHHDRAASGANPLYKRSWAFQELLISRRIACFTAAELQWHCRHCSACECDNWLGYSPSLNVSTLRRQRKAVESPMPKVKPNMSREAAALEAYHRWYEVVEGYSPLLLTLPRDRFPALSALAQHLQVCLNDKYCAGLWLRDLHRGLQWQSSWKAPGICRLTPSYRAPSWSWASVDGRVWYDRTFGRGKNPTGDWRTETDDLHEVAEAVDCAPVSDANSFGEVREGRLRLCGYLTVAKLECPEVTEGSKESSIPYLLWPTKSNQHIERPQYPPTTYRGIFKPDVPLIPYRHVDVHEVAINTARRSFLKPEQARPSFSCTVWVLRLQTYLLVLGPSQRLEDAFERLGLMLLVSQSDVWETMELSSVLIV